MIFPNAKYLCDFLFSYMICDDLLRCSIQETILLVCISCTLNIVEPDDAKSKTCVKKAERNPMDGLHGKHTIDSTQARLATYKYHVLFGAFVGPGAGVMSLLLLLFASGAKCNKT